LEQNMTAQPEPIAPMPPAADPVRQVDRRQFLESAGSLAALAGLNMGVAGQASAATTDRGSLNTHTRLPNGAEFARWEQPLTFSKTYYVDNGSANADDNGPGDSARPFRTIGKAAAVLNPGERVVIASGVYREWVRPARGGTGPGQMISYEAAPGAKVFIRGSEALKDGWKQETVSSGPRNAGAAGVTVWRYDLSSAMFPDLYNPFALPSIMGSWGWLDPTVADMGPYLRRRGLVFVDGKPLEPVEQLNELAMPDLPSAPDFTKPPAPQRGMPPRRRGAAVMQELGATKNGRFYVNNSGTAIYVRLEQGTPADHLIEATTRAATLVPAQSGTGYIRVKGLTFQHAGNAYPYPAGQDGMVSLGGGDHWIFEDNVVEWANGSGLIIGRDAYSGSGAKSPGQAQIVRRNTIRYCGVAGLAGLGTSDTLIEDNLIEWCGWADAERGWEAAGAKFHFAKNMLFHRNVVRHMRHANAVWWDVDNTNCRITRNIFADVLTVGAAVHIEMTPDQNAIDNNIIWDVRNAEPGTPGQRGCAGSGIFDNASSNLIIAHNLIGRCDNAGIFAIVRPDRNRPVADNNTVANNIFTKCKSAIVFLNTNNKADGNLYVGLPDNFQGLFEGTPTQNYDPLAWTHIKYHDLQSWRAIKGWDMQSAVAQAQVDFNVDTLQVTMSGFKALPRVAAFPGYDGDLLGASTSARRVPGPLADPKPGRASAVDPRSKV
jgi:hypothetical protein